MVRAGGNVGVPEMGEAADSAMALQGQELQRCMYTAVMSYKSGLMIRQRGYATLEVATAVDCLAAIFFFI
jgi:hypothetical protein